MHCLFVALTVYCDVSCVALTVHCDVSCVALTVHCDVSCVALIVYCNFAWNVSVNIDLNVILGDAVNIKRVTTTPEPTSGPCK